MGLTVKTHNVGRLNFDKRFGVAAHLDGHYGVGGIVAENHPFFTKFVEGGIGFYGKNYLTAASRRYQAIVINGAAGTIQFNVLEPQRRIAGIFQGKNMLQGLVFENFPQVIRWLGNLETGGSRRCRNAGHGQPRCQKKS